LYKPFLVTGIMPIMVCNCAVHKGQNFMNWGSITRACHPEFAAKMWLRGCVCVLL
jgi:hypothetical protein